MQLQMKISSEKQIKGVTMLKKMILVIDDEKAILMLFEKIRRWKKR